MDAGLLCAETTQVVREQQGDYLGVVKNNHAEVKAVLDDWVTEGSFPPPSLPAMAMTVEKSRGRLEQREVWVVEAGELGPYWQRCGAGRTYSRLGGCDDDANFAAASAGVRSGSPWSQVSRVSAPRPMSCCGGCVATG